MKKKSKKTFKHAVRILDNICFEMEETFNCGDIVDEYDVEYMVMKMSPKDHIRMFERTQAYIGKMRKEVEFLIKEVSVD